MHFHTMVMPVLGKAYVDQRFAVLYSPWFNGKREHRMWEVIRILKSILNEEYHSK